MKKKETPEQVALRRIVHVSEQSVALYKHGEAGQMKMMAGLAREVLKAKNK